MIGTTNHLQELEVSRSDYTRPLHCLQSIPGIVTSLATDSILKENCISLNKSNGAHQQITTPFIAAIAGLILLNIEDAPEVEKSLVTVESFLWDLILDNPLVDFFCKPSGHADIDTTAVVNLFLLKRDPVRYARSVNRRLLVEGLKKARSSKEGAYRVYIERNPNRIDYMANLNLYVFLKQANMCDYNLEKFLISGAREFLSAGSYYYRDIQFPLFMAHIYATHKFILANDRVFRFIRNAIFENPQVGTIVKSTNNLYRSRSTFDESISIDEPFFKQLFNSSKKIYRSPVIDRAVRLYFVYNRMKDADRDHRALPGSRQTNVLSHSVHGAVDLVLSRHT